MTEKSYLDYMEPEASGNELTVLQSLVETQARLEADMAKAELEMTKLKEKWKEIAERKIPDIMDQIGLEEYKTTTGLKVEIKETIRASIPKDKQPLAFGWLKANGHEGLIKRQLSVSFGKGQMEQAEELSQKLSEEYELDDKSSVHASTLTSFVKEKLESGEEVPLDLFGVHRIRSSKVNI